MRCFVAIEFDSTIKKRIGELQKSMVSFGIRGNYTAEDNLHLTLKFLGETDKCYIPEITKAMEKIAKHNKQFVLNFTTLGKFNKGDKPLIWLGIEHNPFLTRVRSMLEDELCGLFPGKLERSAFSPHITLVREAAFNSGIENLNSNDFLGALNENIKNIRLKFNVNVLSLMESTRINGKLSYIRKSFADLNNML